MNGGLPMRVLPPDLSTNDDRLLPSILVVGMDSGLKLRDELINAEATARRLRTELAVADERVEVAKERYRANEAFVRDVWGTLKQGWLAAKDEERAAPDPEP